MREELLASIRTTVMALAGEQEIIIVVPTGVARVEGWCALRTESMNI